MVRIIRAYLKRKALVDRLHAVFFFDSLQASLDLMSRVYMKGAKQ